MVKRNTLSLLGALILAMLVSGCEDTKQLARLSIESLSVSAGAPSVPLSIVFDSGRVCAVFPDRSTMTLDFISFPDADRLPASAPTPSIIDRVDISTPLPATFGEHVLAAFGSALRVLYLGRESDSRLFLKMASLTRDATQWDLDVLEPPGDPLALLTDERGAIEAFWAAGAMKSRLVSGAGPASDIMPSFTLVRRASAAGPHAFTAYGSPQRALFAVRRSAQGDNASVVPGAGPVHASLEATDGTLAVLSWDEAARRLILQEQKTPGAAFSKTTVTLCDGTQSVAILPGSAASSYLFLFDETRLSGNGTAGSQLSLLAPGSLIGAGRARYRKAVITSGQAPISGFAAARTADALYVIVVQGGLKLYRIALFP